MHETMIEAITREKQIKAGSRAKKLALIEALNPEWNDLYDSLILGYPKLSPRHCERSEAIHRATERKNGLLRRGAPRNDGGSSDG